MRLASPEQSEPKSSTQRGSSASPAYSRHRKRVASGLRKRETTWQAIRHALWSTDYMSLGMLALYTLLDIIFIKDVKSSFGILQMNIMMAIGIIAFTMWYDQTGSKIAHIFRSFYILPVGYMMY